jgi:type IV secretion system protein VirB4
MNGAASTAREVRAGQHLPYARHVDDRTIETRDGMLMQMIRLCGAGGEQAYRTRLRDAILRSAGSPRFAVYYHAVYRLAGNELANDFVLTLIHRPLRKRTGLLNRLRQTPAETEDAQATLNTAREALVAALRACEPRLLSVYSTPQGPCSEPLEFLSSLYNAELRPVLLPMQDAGAYLPYRQVSFGQETVELGAADLSPRSFAAIVSVKDYPGQSAPDLFDELLALPFEIIVSQSFGFVEPRPTRSAKNIATLGEHHMTVLVRGETPAEVDRSVAEVHAALADLGVLAVREEIALESAFWAQFPGNFNYIARRGLIPAAHFAGFATSRSEAA